MQCIKTISPYSHSTNNDKYPNYFTTQSFCKQQHIPKLFQASHYPKSMQTRQYQAISKIQSLYFLSVLVLTCLHLRWPLTENDTYLSNIKLLSLLKQQHILKIQPSPKKRHKRKLFQVTVITQTLAQITTISLS